MALEVSIPQLDASPLQRKAQLERLRARYNYREREENQLAPLAVAASPWSWSRHERGYPFFREYFGPSWLRRIVWRRVAADARRGWLRARFGVQKLTGRFDKLRAYELAFPGRGPPFRGISDSDEAFAYWRIAGPNPLSLEQVGNLADLRRRIPIDTGRIERRLCTQLGAVSLKEEAKKGHLFVVDFSALQRSLRPRRERDSRWREKYLPAPIGVFLEAQGFYAKVDLVPLAIQVDRHNPSKGANPVNYPDDGWGWRIAKLYFQAADTSHHVAWGHVHRTHLMLEPFCLATPRQLSERHPVFVLLRPHTRFTLPANQAAYVYYTDRRKTYYEFYAGTLEETRQITIQSYRAAGFRGQALDRELAARGVDRKPARYPYRDDARLWVGPIRKFVEDYLAAFYGSDLDVQADGELQAWAEELMDPKRGAVRDLVAGRRLDTLGKLVDLLSQLLFIAGPGHASQHFSSNHYYRYAPAFPGATYRPPPWPPEAPDRGYFVDALPPLRSATKQVSYNTFSNFKYDRFGHYEGFELGRLEQAAKAIRELQVSLTQVGLEIEALNAGRLLPYAFLHPDEVPNSTNI